MKSHCLFRLTGWAVLSLALLGLSVSCIMPGGWGGRRGGWGGGERGGWHQRG
jgi:hypothetical protein